MLIVISGLPGVGKSAVAAAVATQLGAVHLSVDVMEEALLGAGLTRSWTTGVAAYEAVRAAAEQNLELGRTVVVDAVNDSEAARDTWRTAATRAGGPFVPLVLTLHDETEHRRRLEGRVRNLTHIPEPTWSEIRELKAAYAPWDDSVLQVSATAPVEDVVREIAREVTRRTH